MARPHPSRNRTRRQPKLRPAKDLLAVELGRRGGTKRWKDVGAAERADLMRHVAAGRWGRAT